MAEGAPRKSAFSFIHLFIFPLNHNCVPCARQQACAFDPILIDVMNESPFAYAVLLSLRSDGQLIHRNEGSVVVSWQSPCGG